MKWKYIISVLLFVTGIQINGAKGLNKDLLMPQVQNQTQLEDSIVILNDSVVSSVATSEAISGDIIYSPAIDPATYTINTGLPVGKTEGNLSVEGYANYSIPIEIPAGTNGLQPSISLNYSSGFSDGILGIGWNLGGLSSITRINQTIYNDGKSDVIHGDLTDKYALDGKRLVVLSGYTYGADNSVYGTELEEFSKIVAHGTTGKGPTWFTVYTKSGLIYQYGQTLDSEISNGACILTWKLNKITDRYNNYIEFIYLNTDDEQPIEKIRYAAYGVPYSEILFNYKTRSDVSSYVFGGKKFTHRILLDNIEVKKNGQTFKKYVLDYMRDTFAQLQKVTPYSSQNIAQNPIVFAWTRQTEQLTYVEKTDYFESDQSKYVGDFNGDGREDLVRASTSGDYSWYLYLADENGKLVESVHGALAPFFQTFLVGDFNGDGVTDLMMEQLAATPTYPYQKDYYLYQFNGDTFFRNTSGFTYSSSVPIYTDVVDHNGDGILELLFHSDVGNCDLYTYTGVRINNSGVTSFGKFYVKDLNGDGAYDVLTLSSTSYKVYEFKGYDNKLIETYSGTNFTTSDNLFFGDFNGDGSTEIISKSSLGGGFNLSTLQSSGFQTEWLTSLNNFDIKPENNRMFTRDMNGDGRTDVVLVGRGTNTGNPYDRANIALSSGDGFNTTEYILPNVMSIDKDINYNFGDFNGDGRDEFLYNGNYSGCRLFTYSFASGTPSHLLNTVINGLGSKTSLAYLPMTDNNVYTRWYGFAYPVSSFPSSRQVVSQVNIDNGLGGTTSVTYKYEGAMIHRQGKGFLGFSVFTETDATSGLFTRTYLGYHPIYYYPIVNSVSKNTTGGTAIETTSNMWTEIVLDAATKRIFPYVQSTTQTKNLTGHSVTMDISSIDNYGNIGQTVKTYSNGVTETTVNKYFTDSPYGDWLTGLIDSSKVTYSKSGEIPVSHTVRYTYNSDGITKPDFIYYNEGSSLKYYKNFDYDSRGNVTQEYTYGASIGASQINNSYTYNGNDISAVATTDPLGHVTTRTYDTYGRLSTEKDYLNNTVTYQYDNADRPYTTTSTLGSQSTTTYLWTGTNKPANAIYGVTQTGNDGSVATVWYDKLGRAIRTEKKGFNGGMILTDTEYNSKGQVYRVSDPYFAGSTITWAEAYAAYDDFGRVTTINRNTGRNTTFSYSSNKVTETTTGKTISTWKEYDSQGLVTKASDSGGEITYAYYPDGKVKSITAPGNAVTSMEYNDAARNQTKITDPSASAINYTYDSFGRVKTQTDALGKLTTINYLPDGRIDTRITPEGITTYSYNTSKQLTGISSPGSMSRTYGYDTQGRINNILENIAGSAFSTTFTFDTKGRLATKTHPSGIVETLDYNSYGYLLSFSTEGVTRYSITAANARQQVTAATYSNGSSSMTGVAEFDQYGFPARNAYGPIQDYRYVFNPVTGNLTSRENYLRGKKETFTYDTELDRLTNVTGPHNQTITYLSNGNISTKSDVGTTAFTYGLNAGPYALTGVTTSVAGVISTNNQTATYTSFEKINTISEGDYGASFTYNADLQRAKMNVTIRGASMLTRWYVGASYMKETAGSVTKEYTYLGGDAYTAPMAAIKQGGVTSYFYLLRDYLGNITHVYDPTTNYNPLYPPKEYSFDAWGRRRNASDWSYAISSEPALFADRGFTGHEYLTWFNLYNMNGRLYDPVVGRFLNVDPFVQNSGNTQSYNRYSYCLNNPLKYADPTGNKWRWKWLNPLYWFETGMQAINDNTEGLRKDMAKAGIPDFNVGVNVNLNGNVFSKGNINGHEIWNTENYAQYKGEQVAVQNAYREINQERRDYFQGRNAANREFGYSVTQQFTKQLIFHGGIKLESYHAETKQFGPNNSNIEIIIDEREDYVGTKYNSAFGSMYVGSDGTHTAGNSVLSTGFDQYDALVIDIAFPNFIENNSSSGYTLYLAKEPLTNMINAIFPKNNSTTNSYLPGMLPYPFYYYFLFPY